MTVTPTGFMIERPPANNDELYWLVRALWGVIIPRTKVCPDHVAPFTAFADAYFERNSLDPTGMTSMALWHGSRGLSGKSYALAILGLTKAFLLGSDTNILGGSLAQSTNVHEHMRTALESKNSPRYMIADEGNTKITLTNKARIRPLTASQRTVRGPHPPFLLLDEIDEMEIKILDAALGQPMEQKNYLGDTLDPYTVMCSTWQNPQGCVVLSTPIVTRRGEVPIQEVVIGDEVPTRDGWRQVTNVINTGLQECVTVKFASGRRLTCTPWHPVWTSEGFNEASALAPGAHVVALVSGVSSSEFSGSNQRAFPATPAAFASGLFGARQSQVVPEVADGLGHALDARVVDLGSHRLQMARIDAGAVSAAALLDVIEREPVRNGPDDFLVDPPMRQVRPLTAGVPSVGLVPVAVLPDMEGPQDALIGVQIDGYVFADDQVVNVAHHGMVLPTWDLTVEDTHEYVAEGILVHNTFTEIIRRAEEQKIPIYRWCYRESNNKVDGWLSDKGIAQKKNTINKEMWRVEYELGEPAIGNRAFDSEAVEELFSLPFAPIKSKEQKDFEEFTFAIPEPGGTYVIGADWAKEQDYTVISVIRTDTHSAELVYWARLNRRPYPFMIKMFNDAMQLYNAQGEYDRTGLGNVVTDYLDMRAHGFMMIGEKRSSMLSEYVNAVEQVGKMRFPKIPSAYIAHKYAQVGDLYSAQQQYHLPDEVCALALAWYRKTRAAPPANPLVIGKTDEPNRYQKIFEPNHMGRIAGEVTSSEFEDRGLTLLG